MVKLIFLAAALLISSSSTLSAESLEPVTERIVADRAPGTISLPFKHTAAEGAGNSGLASLSGANESGGGVSVLRVLEGLLLCGILLSGLVVFLKKKGYSANVPNSRKLRIIERMAISPKSSLLLVERDGKKLLLSVGSERVTLLDAQDDSSFIRLNQTDLVCDDALELSV